MTVEHSINVVKDGKNCRILVAETKTSEPTLTIVGNEYKFNTRILVDKMLSAKELTAILSTLTDGETK